MRLICPAERLICPAMRLICPAERLICPAESQAWPAERGICPAERVIWPAGKDVWPDMRGIWPAESRKWPACRTALGWVADAGAAEGEGAGVCGGGRGRRASDQHRPSTPPPRQHPPALSYTPNVHGESSKPPACQRLVDRTFKPVPRDLIRGGWAEASNVYSMIARLVRRLRALHAASPRRRLLVNLILAALVCLFLLTAFVTVAAIMTREV
jgi:hypothetical protein